MSKEMLINAAMSENVRAAIVAAGKLWQYFEESEQLHRTRGNIYLGRVTSVRPSLDACFVDYGEKRHGLLPAKEVVLAQAADPSRSSAHNIRKLVKQGQMLLVQVEKEPVGEKGARLTTDISLAGRHLVLMPYSGSLGVSRKIRDGAARKLARDLVSQLKPPRGMGLIVRTVAAGETKRTLLRDLNYLVRLWKDIQVRSRKLKKTGLVHAEADLVTRILRDYYDNDVQKVLIDGDRALESARHFFRLFAPRQSSRLQLFPGPEPIFSHFGIEEQIDQIHERTVALSSGGSLVIDPTEALVAIDVNSGKMSGKPDVERTALESNLEAAEEVARQLRLRNLGGIIVIDFIDMNKSSNRKEVERRLRRAMADDKARHRVGPISAFGLCTLTRQRLEQPLRLIGFNTCPRCQGIGLIRSSESLAIKVMRDLESHAARRRPGRVEIRANCDLANALQNRYRQQLAHLEREVGLRVEVFAEAGRDTSSYELQVHETPAVGEAYNEGAESTDVVAEQPQPTGNNQREQEPAGKKTSRRKRRRRRRKKSTPTLP